MKNLQKSKQNLQKSKPIFVEVGLNIRTRHQRIVSAFSDVVVSVEQAAYYAEMNVDIVSLLLRSLSHSLACFFPFLSLADVSVRIIDSSPSGVCLPFRGRDTYHIASNLAADILGQIL